MDSKIEIEQKGLSRKRRLSIVRRELRREGNGEKAVVKNNKIIVRDRIASKQSHVPAIKNKRASKARSSRSIYLQFIKLIKAVVVAEQTISIKNMRTKKLNKAYDLESSIKIKESQKVISHISSSTVHNFDRSKRRKRNKQARTMRLINS